MPVWSIHTRWAQKMGISGRVSDYVNQLIDFPEKCSDFLDFAADKDN